MDHHRWLTDVRMLHQGLHEVLRIEEPVPENARDARDARDEEQERRVTRTHVTHERHHVAQLLA